MTKIEGTIIRTISRNPSGALRLTRKQKAGAGEANNPNVCRVIIGKTLYIYKTTPAKYVELFCYHAAKLLEIDVCYTDLALLEGKSPGIISKYFVGNYQEAKIISGKELLLEYVKKLSTEQLRQIGMPDNLSREQITEIQIPISTENLAINNLDVIWLSLMDRYRSRYTDEKQLEASMKIVMQQVVKMLIFDTITSNHDRHYLNYYFIETADQIRLAPLFDFDNSLSEVKNLPAMGTKFRDVTELDRFEQFIYSLIETSDEYYNLFVEMFNKLYDNIDTIFKNMESQLNKQLTKDIKQKLRNKLEPIRQCIASSLKKYKKKKAQH